MERLTGQIAVLGCGVTGQAVARFVLARRDLGDQVGVTVFDERDDEGRRTIAEELRAAGARVELGARSVTESFALCIASPGIPPSSELMISAREMCDEVVSEIEFAYRRSAGPWLAVTGTNGKTTVTSLCAHILRFAGRPTECVGNIGDPAISIAEVAGESSVIVAEVSSFQLSLTHSFHPRVGVLLNITPDHIDWHGSLEAYRRDKMRMFANMSLGDVAVVDIDDAGAAPVAESIEQQGLSVIRVSAAGRRPCDATVQDGWLTLEIDGVQHRLVRAEELRIRGRHNHSNALAAIAATHAVGVPLEVIAEAVVEFEPIAHRLQPVGVVDDVEYINDSKATNPGATKMALTAFEDRPVILMLGGQNKGNDFRELAPVLSGVRTVVAFGEAGDEIAEALEAEGIAVERALTMRDALSAARGAARPGDVVLLAPACASFDEFSGYAERGRVFTSAVASFRERVS